MATREVLNVQDEFGEDITVFRPTFSDWELIDQKEVKDGKEAYYQLMAGDPEHPAVIRLGAYEKADGTKSYSGRIDTVVKVTDDNSVVSYKKLSMTVARTSDDGVHGGESNEVKLLQNLLIFAGFMGPRVTPTLQASPSGADTTLINRRKFGIPTFDLSAMDDPAQS